MYIRRWLEAPVEMPDGSIMLREGKGVPQGGVISPLLSNLFLYYCIDRWMGIQYPNIRMVRYADDIVVHCQSYKEAETLLSNMEARFTCCGLSLHRKKSKIVYCKKSGRNVRYKPVQFDFLGFSFQPLSVRLKRGGSFSQYDCKLSRKSKKRILKSIRGLNLHRRTGSTIQDLGELLNSKLRGWINYYGKINLRSLKPIFYHLHYRMIKWVLKKYKRFNQSRIKAVNWLRHCARSYPNLFYHWELGYHFT